MRRAAPRPCVSTGNGEIVLAAPHSAQLFARASHPRGALPTFVSDTFLRANRLSVRISFANKQTHTLLHSRVQLQQTFGRSGPVLSCRSSISISGAERRGHCTAVLPSTRTSYFPSDLLCSALDFTRLDSLFRTDGLVKESGSNDC